jgi:hypothetical protein
VNPLATYSFLPWLRHGVAGAITSADGDAGVAGRATMPVVLQLTGDPVAGGAQLVQQVARDVALYGPGDVVGIDARAIVRTEPWPWITNFEPNFLPAIDFYDEDFPWRYTPAAPDPSGIRLRPWMALVVLREDEFEDGRPAASRPLRSIAVGDANLFPPADQLWAWAHVHFNRPLSASPAEVVSPNMNAVLPRVQTVLAQDPDAAYARLMCPRRLDPDTGYHAFVVPTFETGRLAGLGLDPAQAPYATFSAWAAYQGRQEPANYPVYHRWYFRTGSRGDFEYLVGLLKPQPVDGRVGTRDMDVTNPGSNLPAAVDPAQGGNLRLGGALRVPGAGGSDGWDQPYPNAFEQALAAFVNLPDDYAAKDAAVANADSGLTADPDPLITAPLYGQWHALTRRLLTRRDGTPAPNPDNWVHRLNLDQRHRVAAGFGAAVVETNAETYMQYAWEQIGDVLAANQLVRRLHLAVEVAARWYDGHLTPLTAARPERTLSVLDPVAGRVLDGGATMAHARASSVVQPALTSTAMRRVVRPGGRLMRSLSFAGGVTPDNLLQRVATGQVSAAPPKAVPAGVATVDAAAAAAPKPLDVTETGQHPDRVNALPRSPDFVLSTPGQTVRVTPGSTDSPVASRLKAALEDSYELLVASRDVDRAPKLIEIDLTRLPKTAEDGVDPRQTIPGRGLSTIDMPPWVREQVGDGLVEAMAYPKIDLPMYEALKAISIELFLPNINLVPDNSITLIETNPPFIESYMVGLNHEFGRKLLWREYPTDQRGSYFRQFWDVRGYIDSEGLSEDPLKEKLYDIPELHLWSHASSLGEHDNRVPAGQAGAQTVLVIRGELLKKYPTAVIYAHRAEWARNPDQSIDLTRPRSLVTLTVAEEQTPPRDKMRTPLYEAKADPDVSFLGFDLTIAEVRGQSGEQPGDDPGWFFVIKERPGDPRFGLELARTGPLEVFDELTWDDAALTGSAAKFLSATGLQQVSLAAPPAGDPKSAQHADDATVAAAAPSSARWAYLLYRAPVIVAIHADEMLGTEGP